MIAAWMLYSLAVGVLVGLAALAGDRACRMVRWPRRGVWVAALAVAVVLSWVSLVRVSSPADATSLAPSLSFAPSSPVTEPASGIAALGAGLLHFVQAARSAVLGVLDSGYAAAAGGADRLAGGGILLAIWAAGSAAVLLLLGLTLLRLYRARRAWRRHRIGGVPVLLSEGFGPAVIGLVRPVIVVPSWLLAEPLQAQQVIVEHEEEHRRARDPLLLAGACAAVCLLPWNLALWWLLSRLRLAVELDCDDRILRRGVTPLSYGSLLLEVAGRTPARLFGAPALADSRIHLERRLLAMTQRNQVGGWGRPALAAAAALLLAAAACNTDVPTAAVIERMDAADAEQQAKQAGLLPTIAEGRPLYVVDGKVVTEAEARAVAPADIASIEVLKQGAAAIAYGEKGANGVIRMKRRTALAAGEQPPGQEAKIAMRELAPSKQATTVEGHALRRKAGQALTSVEGLAAKKAEATARALPSGVRVTGSERSARATTVTGVKVRSAAPGGMAPAIAVPDLAAPTITLPRTKAPGIEAPRADEAADAQLPARTENPFVVVDGVPARASVRLPSLAPEEIMSVEVLKGEEAVRRYGPRAVNGAVVITTKQGGVR